MPIGRKLFNDRKSGQLVLWLLLENTELRDRGQTQWRAHKTTLLLWLSGYSSKTKGSESAVTDEGYEEKLLQR